MGGLLRRRQGPFSRSKEVGNPGLKDGSYYIWYTCIAGSLEATTYETDLSRGMEQRAKEEAQRRTILGQAFRGGPGAPARAMVAEYWRDVAIRRADIRGNVEAARNLAAMQASLAAAQDHFNSAYEDYARISREMANQAAEMQTLNLIGAVLSAAGSVATAHETIKAWRAAKASSLAASQASAKATAEGARSELLHAQDQAAQGWQNRGYAPVQPAEVPNITNPFEQPEDSTVDPNAAVKRPILM